MYYIYIPGLTGVRGPRGFTGATGPIGPTGPRGASGTGFNLTSHGNYDMTSKKTDKYYG